MCHKTKPNQTKSPCWLGLEYMPSASPFSDKTYLPMNVLIMTLSHLMVRLKSWCLREYGVTPPLPIGLRAAHWPNW